MAEVARGQDVPILVLAGTVRQARDWIVTKGISPAWVEIITPNTLTARMQGKHGNPHVILCGQLTGGEIEQFQEYLAIIGSPPLEDIDDPRLCVSGGHGPADLG